MATVVATASVTFSGEDTTDVSASVEVVKKEIGAEIPYVSQSEFLIGETAYFLLYLSAGVTFKKAIISHKELFVNAAGSYVSEQEDFLSFQVYDKYERDNDGKITKTNYNEVKTKYPMIGSFTHEYFGDDLGTPLALSDQTIRASNYGISGIKVNYQSRALVFSMRSNLGLKLYKGKAQIQVVFVCEKAA